ncbi:MAG: HlyD family secretion protein [Bryobacterales bacterium]|nr:HlyD family secretion protein [Bryobacterales bacterium]
MVHSTGKTITVVAALCSLLSGCSTPRVSANIADPPKKLIPPPATSVQTLRATGTVEALHSVSIHVPRVSGQQSGNLTLTKLVENGAMVHTGDIVAEFDRIAQIKNARDAETKYDDLSHQVDQKAAQHSSNAAKRSSDLAQAEADLQKAKLEIRKGPVLSELDQLKNAEKLKDAEAHLASLHKSQHAHELAEAAELGVLKLQRERQKSTLARLRADADRLVLRASLSGMAALENIWRNNSMGHAKEGDTPWPGSPLVRVFDPTSMVLRLSVSEADGAILQPGTRATVHLDAYPELTFTARFDSASPVASSALGSPLKTFTAQFFFDQSDPHLLPDMAAAADIQRNVTELLKASK